MKLVRESLFSSTIRSFCISFFAVIGITIAIFLVLLVFGAGKNTKSLESSNFEITIPDTNGRKLSPASSGPYLLRIDFIGLITGNSGSGLSQGGVSIESIRSILNESQAGPLRNNRVKGLLLYFNSPGGYGTLCEPIYESIKQYSLKYQLPVYAYVEGCCASAAMYIACAADKIYANNTSIIGSVGSYWRFFNFSGGMEKVGIQNKTLKAGKDKDAMNPFQPWQEGDDANYVTILNQDYMQFVDIVSSARPKLTKDLLINKYGAQVYMSEEAEKYGYIDGAGYQYNQVVQMLADEAGIRGTDYQVIQLQPRLSFSSLLSMSNQLSQQSALLKAFKENPYTFLAPVIEKISGSTLNTLSH